MKVTKVEGSVTDEDRFRQFSPVYEMAKVATPDHVQQPGYYGLPILKKPFWKWEIALYFFCEGISAGSYILATVADVLGEHKEVVKAGRYVSLALLLPCPPLLIGDLGRPERFHHMLRIFKRTSPMNHGAWALSGYGVFSTLMASLEPASAKIPFAGAILRWLQQLLPRKLVSLLGIPFALTMVSYPGVLLSTTSIPVWAQTHFLGALLAASSMSTAASAMTLFTYRSKTEEGHEVLTRFEDAAAGVEAIALGAYLVSARRAARPLLRGKQSRLFLFGAILGGLVLPLLLRRSRSKALRSGVAPLSTIAGGLALKWSITYAGQESALDANLAVHNSPSKSGDPFWSSKQTVG